MDDVTVRILADIAQALDSIAMDLRAMRQFFAPRKPDEDKAPTVVPDVHAEAVSEAETAHVLAEDDLPF